MAYYHKIEYYQQWRAKKREETFLLIMSKLKEDWTVEKHKVYVAKKKD